MPRTTNVMAKDVPSTEWSCAPALNARITMPATRSRTPSPMPRAAADREPKRMPRPAATWATPTTPKIAASGANAWSVARSDASALTTPRLMIPSAMAMPTTLETSSTPNAPCATAATSRDARPRGIDAAPKGTGAAGAKVLGVATGTGLGDMLTATVLRWSGSGDRLVPSSSAPRGAAIGSGRRLASSNDDAGRSALRDLPSQAHAAELVVELLADPVEVRALDVELLGDPVDEPGFGRVDLVVRGHHEEAGADQAMPLLDRRDRLELARDEEVLGRPELPRQRRRHVHDELGGLRVEPGLACDVGHLLALGFTHLEVRVRRTAQQVGERRDVP